MKESELSNEVKRFFSQKVQDSEFNESVEVLNNENVLMNLTIGREPKSKKWQYYLGMQEQDIIFFLKDEADSIRILETPIKYHWASSAQRAKSNIRIPLLICELKVNEHLNSAQFITYSKIAEQIKDVHPHCAYFFIVGGPGSRKVMAETVLRQAKSFSRVYLDWENEKAAVWHDIENHLIYLKEKLNLF